MEFGAGASSSSGSLILVVGFCALLSMAVVSPVLLNANWRALQKQNDLLRQHISISQEVSGNTSFSAQFANTTATPVHRVIDKNYGDGFSVIHRFGYNPDVDSGTLPEDVWDGGGVYSFPTQLQLIQAVSDSANDAPAGTGMRTLIVIGLNEDWIATSDVIQLQGTTPVNGTVMFLRVLRMFGSSFGSTGENQGTVAVTGTVDTSLTFAQINPTNGQTMQAITTVPDERDVCLYHWTATLARTGTPSGAMAVVELMFRYNADEADSGWRVQQIMGLAATGSSGLTVKWEPCLNIPSRTDIRVRVIEGTDTNMQVASNFGMSTIRSGALATTEL